MKQLIISIGREFGSGGHEIAERIAKHFGMPIYDHNLLDKIAEQKNVESENLKEFDERRHHAMKRTVRGMSTSASENIANLQFEFLREKADSGESFVVVGRCSETILKEYPGLITIFINGDMEKKIERIIWKYNMSREDAIAFIKKKDRKRRIYHNTHCDSKWGDSRNYELTINSSKLGIDNSVNMLTAYIDERIKQLHLNND